MTMDSLLQEIAEEIALDRAMGIEPAEEPVPISPERQRAIRDELAGFDVEDEDGNDNGI